MIVWVCMLSINWNKLETWKMTFFSALFVNPSLIFVDIVSVNGHNFFFSNLRNTPFKVLITRLPITVTKSNLYWLQLRPLVIHPLSAVKSCRYYNKQTAHLSWDKFCFLFHFCCNSCLKEKWLSFFSVFFFFCQFLPTLMALCSLGQSYMKFSYLQSNRTYWATKCSYFTVKYSSTCC